MLPEMGPRPPGKPKNLKPHLNVKLKFGWRYDDAQRIFVSVKGKKLPPFKDLPRGTRIVYTVPHLAHMNEASLSQNEKELSRFMQVILPKKSDTSKFLEILNVWPCFEEVNLPPEISLPTDL